MFDFIPEPEPMVMRTRIGGDQKQHTEQRMRAGATAHDHDFRINEDHNSAHTSVFGTAELSQAEDEQAALMQSAAASAQTSAQAAAVRAAGGPAAHAEAMRVFNKHATPAERQLLDQMMNSGDKFDAIAAGRGLAAYAEQIERQRVLDAGGFDGHADAMQAQRDDLARYGRLTATTLQRMSVTPTSVVGGLFS